MKVLLKTSYGPLSFRKEIYEKFNISYHDISSRYNDDEWLVPNNPICKTKLDKITELAYRQGSSYVCDPSKCIVEVVEIPKGTAYRICEYDGSEYIEYRDEIDWKIAE